MKVSTIRPGLLVSLKTHINGNVQYHKLDLGQKIEGETEISKWETERSIADPKEFHKAKQVRMLARRTISRHCFKSSFGLLCAEDNIGKLEEGIKEANDLATKFNAKSKLTRVTVNVLSGRIASDDAEAARAINGEIAGLIERMEKGVKTLNVTEIRDAARRAKQIGGMVAANTSAKLAEAIDAARGAARKLTKAGEEAAKQVDTEALKLLRASRTAFLDIDEETPKPAPVKTKATKGRAVDLEIN